MQKLIAMDCEMVGTGSKGNISILAKVSLVDEQGSILYDSFVKPTSKVTNYRTPISGIREEDLVNAENFYNVQDEVKRIIRGNILVGHSLKSDLKCLHITHPAEDIRDTSVYPEFQNGRTPHSLKNLVKQYLGINIQESEHCSIEDARAVMKLYLSIQEKYEAERPFLSKKELKRERRKQLYPKEKQEERKQLYLAKVMDDNIIKFIFGEDNKFSINKKNSDNNQSNSKDMKHKENIDHGLNETQRDFKQLSITEHGEANNHFVITNINKPDNNEHKKIVKQNISKLYGFDKLNIISAKHHLIDEVGQSKDPFNVARGNQMETNEKSVSEEPFIGSNQYFSKKMKMPNKAKQPQQSVDKNQKTLTPFVLNKERKPLLTAVMFDRNKSFVTTNNKVNKPFVMNTEHKNQTFDEECHATKPFILNKAFKEERDQQENVTNKKYKQEKATISQ